MYEYSLIEFFDILQGAIVLPYILNHMLFYKAPQMKIYTKRSYKKDRSYWEKIVENAAGFFRQVSSCKAFIPWSPKSKV